MTSCERRPMNPPKAIASRMPKPRHLRQNAAWKTEAKSVMMTMLSLSVAFSYGTWSAVPSSQRPMAKTASRARYNRASLKYAAMFSVSSSRQMISPNGRHDS
jgi:hypothetical protein